MYMMRTKSELAYPKSKAGDLGRVKNKQTKITYIFILGLTHSRRALTLLQNKSNTWKLDQRCHTPGPRPSPEGCCSFIHLAYGKGLVLVLSSVPLLTQGMTTGPHPHRHPPNNPSCPPLQSLLFLVLSPPRCLEHDAESLSQPGLSPLTLAFCF